MAVEDSRETVLLPEDASLLRIDDLAATPPTNVNNLQARIGFLGVSADLTGLSLGSQGDDAAVTLGRVGGGSAPLPINTLLNEDGGLDPDQVDLTSNVTAGIAFTATERRSPDGVLRHRPESRRLRFRQRQLGAGRVAQRDVRDRLPGSAGLRPGPGRVPLRQRGRHPGHRRGPRHGGREPAHRDGPLRLTRRRGSASDTAPRTRWLVAW